MENLVNALVSGLISGSLYATMALGLTIIYGVSRVFNFGHGVIAVIGAYITWYLLSVFGVPFLPATLLSLAFMASFGWLVYRFTMSPLLKKPNWEFSTVLFMLGAGILLENVVLQVFGPRVKSIPVLVDGALKVGFIQINWHEVALMGIVLVVIAALSLFFKYTRTGQAMRAVAQSIPGAQVVGINIEQIFGLTFALAFTVTGFSGILLGTKYYLNPHVGWEWMVKGFVIVTFGGLGSTSGAVVAALVLGLVEAVATLYFGAIWVWPIWFVLFLIVLLLRPQGILGGRT
ncbi:MAG: branched-chain amino acid ABC transporter permease [Anaerolineales bacterium]|nr:branched-chain amino acid ABC transporter permease [Anaerolineales bacterium]MDW8161266.1 branched-chain amino acid ABC transporter permease [Anaerolineales bacterium]